jgi:hypothetical protein
MCRSGIADLFNRIENARYQSLAYPAATTIEHPPINQKADPKR